jgi:hypothetical protein
MAPGLSCADRPWIGVPSAFCSSLVANAARQWNFTPKRRWNDHPVFRRVETGFASVTINARR